MSKRKGSRRPYFNGPAGFLKKEFVLDKNGYECCVDCGNSTTWLDREDLKGRKVMRTSPFIRVDTPYGKRLIHDWCLYIQNKKPIKPQPMPLALVQAIKDELSKPNIMTTAIPGKTP